MSDYTWTEVTFRQALDHAFMSGGIRCSHDRVHGLGEGEYAEVTQLLDGTAAAVGSESGWPGTEVTPGDGPEPRCYIGRPTT